MTIDLKNHTSELEVKLHAKESWDYSTTTEKKYVYPLKQERTRDKEEWER